MQNKIVILEKWILILSNNQWYDSKNNKYKLESTHS